MANNMEASQETYFGGTNNPDLSPDYQKVCLMHIDCLESLGREIGKKLH